MDSKRVLVLGGYGGFGGRLARRLAGDGWQVVVAGRCADKARRFAASLPSANGITADRNGDIAAVLSAIRPYLLIDAAGPFQKSSYRVVEACIAAGVHYLDLADGRDFVCRVAGFDVAAQAAGVAVVSGASSVPALSGAVVRDLSPRLDRVDAIELAISASDRATAGASVAAAILSYAGKPVSLWRDGRWTALPGWSEVRLVRYELPDAAPLHRTVALVDVPDHAILPEAVPGVRSVTFRAGPEFGFQVRALWLASWLVRLGLIGSLTGWARWLRPLQQLTAPLCSDRSAMLLELRGERDGGAASARWTLIAEQGDGPEIPTLAAQLLARRIAAGTLSPGARHAGGELALDDFRALFAELAIREGTILA